MSTTVPFALCVAPLCVEVIDMPYRRRTLIAAAGIALLICAAAGLWLLRDRPRSFAQLAAAAESVPVPAGVTLLDESSTVNDGPGFTTSKAEQVTRRFSTSMTCADLTDAWSTTLRAHHIRYTLQNYAGEAGIRLTIHNGYPEFLGITLGSLGRCTAPFVWSFNRLH